MSYKVFGEVLWDKIHISIFAFFQHLIWIFKRDNEIHELRRSQEIIQTDLIPMLINYCENVELCDVLLRLLVTGSFVSAEILSIFICF